MTPPGPVAIVAATDVELAGLRDRLASEVRIDLPGADGAWRGRIGGRDVVVAACGVGTVAAATCCAVLHAALAPSVMVMTGIAGTFAGAFIPVGAAVAAASEFDLDGGVALAGTQPSLASIPLARATGPTGPTYEEIATDPGWRDALAAATGTVPVPFATSDAVSGDLDVAAARAARSGASIESMEGFGAALACLRLGVRFAEVRGVSNVAGIRDKGAWEVRAAVGAATIALLEALTHPVD